MALLYTFTTIYSTEQRTLKYTTTYKHPTEIHMSLHSDTDAQTHTRFNTWMHVYMQHQCAYILLHPPIKSHETSPYCPSQVYCSWHLKGPLNNWSERSWLVCSLTWYVCPAHHQAADNLTHQVCNHSWPRQDQNRWSQSQFIFRILVPYTHNDSQCPLPRCVCADLKPHNRLFNKRACTMKFISARLDEYGTEYSHSVFALIGIRQIPLSSKSITDVLCSWRTMPR